MEPDAAGAVMSADPEPETSQAPVCLLRVADGDRRAGEWPAESEPAGNAERVVGKGDGDLAPLDAGQRIRLHTEGRVAAEPVVVERIGQ